jgi:hypothetical protein
MNITSKYDLGDIVKALSAGKGPGAGLQGTADGDFAAVLANLADLAADGLEASAGKEGSVGKSEVALKAALNGQSGMTLPLSELKHSGAEAFDSLVRQLDSISADSPKTQEQLESEENGEGLTSVSGLVTLLQASQIVTPSVAMSSQGLAVEKTEGRSAKEQTATLTSPNTDALRITTLKDQRAVLLGPETATRFNFTENDRGAIPMAAEPKNTASRELATATTIASATTRNSPPATPKQDDSPEYWNRETARLLAEMGRTTPAAKPESEPLKTEALKVERPVRFDVEAVAKAAPSEGGKTDLSVSQTPVRQVQGEVLRAPTVESAPLRSAADMLKPMEDTGVISAKSSAKSATPTDTTLAQTASASAVAAGILQGDKAPQLKRSQVANQEIGTTTTSAIEKTGRAEVSARLSEALGPQPIAQADRQVAAGLASQLTVQAPTQSPSSNVTQLESSSALSATNNVALSVGADPSAGLGTDSSIQNNQRVSVGNLPQGIAARVNTHLAKGLGSGPTKISISLFPENYGQVDVEFVYSEEAGLKINLSSENAETTRLLQSNSSALRETLLGNSLASVSVDVNARGKQSESGERNETAARSANTSDDADTLNSSDGADSRIGGNKTSTNGLDTYV